MACFADISVSQGSVATYARCGGIFNIRLTTNFSRNLPVRIFFKSVHIWQNCGRESVAPLFRPTLYIVTSPPWGIRWARWECFVRGTSCRGSGARSSRRCAVAGCAAACDTTCTPRPAWTTIEPTHTQQRQVTKVMRQKDASPFPENLRLLGRYMWTATQG